MKKKAFLTLVLLIISLFLFSENAFALTLKEGKAMGRNSFEKKFGNKIVSPDLAVFTVGKGYLLLPARDYKTRQLEWYLVDPFNDKLIDNGKCPFKVFTEMAASANGSSIIAFSRYPIAIWHLNLNSSNNGWTKVYENPKKNGLALMQFSPLIFTNDDRAYSIMDKWDDQHFVTDTVVTAFMVNPFSIDPIISVKALADKAAKIAIQGNPKNSPKNLKFFIDPIRFAPQNNIVFILRSTFKSGKADYDFMDYLFKMNASGKLTVVDGIFGRMLPFDHLIMPDRILYRTFDGQKVKVIYAEGNDKKVIFTGKALMGKILANGLIGIAAVNDKNFEIYIGSPKSGLKKMLSLKKPYRVGFVANGSGFVLIGMNEIRTFKIIQ